MPRIRNQQKFEQDQSHVVNSALALIARKGVRGATLRDIASESDFSLSKLVNLFSNKEQLMRRCCEEIAKLEAARLELFEKEIDEQSVNIELLPRFLWAFCMDSGAQNKNLTQLLFEFAIASVSNAEYSAICAELIAARLDVFRGFADRFDLSHEGMEIICLHLLAESSFMISCSASTSYQIAAESAFYLAFGRFGCLKEQLGTVDVSSVIDRFHVAAHTDEYTVTTLTRGEESRINIENAAADIIANSGLASVTNRAVAEQAGVSLALTTYHFESIGELAYAGLQQLFKRINSGSRVADTSVDPAREIKGLLRERRKSRGVERLSLDITEISLADSRTRDGDGLGLALRRQVGSVTFSRFEFSGINESRTVAACYSLWAQAVLLIDALAPVSEFMDLDLQITAIKSNLLHSN